jgi:hypothetical protein
MAVSKIGNHWNEQDARSGQNIRENELPAQIGSMPFPVEIDIGYHAG